MPHFSKKSKAKMATCDPRLQEIFNEAIKIVDFMILEGHREEDRQNELYEAGKSKVKYPYGKHNKRPSKAGDAAPWPIDWEDRERFYFLAGVIIAIGAMKGIKIRYGGDWDGDRDFKDNQFDDLVHFEIID